MARCLTPIKLKVGIKKDRNLHIPTQLQRRNKELYILDSYNKKPGIILAPCGKCYNCRLNRARDWTIRTIHEYSRPEFSRTFMYFLTLTYSNEHIGNNSLDYRDVQLFLKRLRKEFKDDTLKFLCVGEYGHQSGRKHWHLIIFGFKKLVKYRTFWNLWRYGHIDASPVRSYSSIGYMLKYSFKDYKSPRSRYIEDDRTPPMFRCSKGFGKEYALNNLDEIIKTGYIQHNKYKYRVPRFYRELYYKINFIDCWKEYDDRLHFVHQHILDDLSKYGFTDIVSNLELFSDKYYDAYLKVMRPINKLKNEKLFDNYFKHFYEKV